MDNPFEFIIERLNALDRKISILMESGNDKYPVQDEFLNIEEVARFINESKSSVYSRTSSRNIPFYKRGKRLMFKKSEIMSWLESGKKKTRSEIAREIS
jgi:excisionase family DNA binding protein